MIGGCTDANKGEECAQGSRKRNYCDTSEVYRGEKMGELSGRLSHAPWSAPRHEVDLASRRVQK